MNKTRVTLKIVAQVYMIVDDQVQIIDRSIVVTTSKIQSGDFIIEYQDTVMINITRVLF
jgi:hypothetical protein